MKLTCLLLFFWRLSLMGFSQSTLSGSITDVNGKAIAFANVLLLNQSDSVLVKGAVTDVEGKYILSNIAKGNYFIASYLMGFAKSFSPPINIEEKTSLSVEAITLAEDTRTLEEVVVKAAKPLYEMDMGKMVVNVQSSITSAGLSAIDVLERSPGIFVNRQNSTFSLGGKYGVIVLVNGKRSRLPVEAVFQMLEGINAGDIEKIEIMTVPPANYDADGDAGFINIVMQKGNGVTGTSGTFMGSMGYGTGPSANSSLNLNHQGKRVNLFGSYAFNYLKQRHLWRNNRESSNETESVFSSNEAERNNTRTIHNYQLGFDFFMGKNTIFSGLMSGYDNLFQLNAPTSTHLDYSVAQDTLIAMTMLEKNHWQHLMGNLNLQHTFGKGQIVNINLDYLTYHNANPSDYDNTYYASTESFVRHEENSISKDTPIKIWVATLDYSMKIGASTTLESGFKSTLSHLINDVVFEEKKGDRWIMNPLYTNYADLTEDILAAFSSIKVSLDEKTSLQAGIRYEHTKTYLKTLEEGGVVDRDYGNFFPSLFLSRKLKENHLVQFSYGRRISRPTFNEMAPFVVFLDPKTFFAGNANILPTFTHNIKGDYAYKSFLFSLQYSLDKDVIMRFQPQVDPETNTLIFVSDNIDLRHTLATTLTLPFQLTHWWEMQNNLTANWQKIDTELNGEHYARAQTGAQLNSTHTFKLPKSYTFELAGNYISPIINGYFNWLSRGFVNFGIQKEFDKGGTLRLACNDIFETNQLKWKTFDDASFDLDGRLKWDKRRFVITYSQKFGNQKVKGARKRSTGSKEEQNRVTN